MRRIFLYLLSGLLLDLLFFGNATALYASDIIRKKKFSYISTSLLVIYFTNLSQKEYYYITQAEDLVLVAYRRNGTERHPRKGMFGDFNCPANFNFKKPSPDWMNPRAQAIES